MASLLSYFKSVITFDMETIQELRNDSRMIPLSVILLLINALIHATIMALTDSFDYFVPYFMLNPRLSTFTFSYPKPFSLKMFTLTLAFDLTIILGTLILGMILLIILSDKPPRVIITTNFPYVGFASIFLTIGSILTLLTFLSGYNPPILARVIQITAIGLIIVYLHALIVTTDVRIPPWKILPILWLFLIATISFFGIIVAEGGLAL